MVVLLWILIVGLFIGVVPFVNWLHKVIKKGLDNNPDW